jgi:ArsR family metal-binding transcriptional regulator
MSSLDPDVFLDSLELAKTLPCLAEPGRIIVIGTPTPPLDEVLPLIAAISPSLIAFNPRTPSVTLRRKPGFITFYRDQVIVTQVKDVSEGLEMISALRDLVNLCWKQRATVKPATEARQAPRPLDVWTLLPRTNCKRCGEATCVAFASTLLLRRREIDDCPILAQDPDFAERRKQVAALL